MAVVAVVNQQKRHFGYQNGDRVVANFPKGKRAGIQAGRVAMAVEISFPGLKRFGVPNGD